MSDAVMDRQRLAGLLRGTLADTTQLEQLPSNPGSRVWKTLRRLVGDEISAASCSQSSDQDADHDAGGSPRQHNVESCITTTKQARDPVFQMTMNAMSAVEVAIN